MPVFFFGVLIALIVSAVVAAASAAASAAAVVIPVLVQLWNAIAWVGLQIAQLATTFYSFVSKAFQALYSNVLVPIVDAARRFYERFTAFLDKVFGPIIKIVERIQEILNTIWTNVIAPIMDAIEKLRLGLRLLAELGVPFVERLESILRRIQQEIFTRFRQVQTIVNTASFWLDLLMDPRGWIRATPWLYTLWRFAGNAFNIVTGLADTLGLHRERLEQFRGDNPPTGISDTAERFRSGELGATPGVQSAAARFRSGQSGRVA